VAAKTLGERCVQPATDIRRERRRFRVAENVDGLFCGVYDYATLGAPAQMLFEFRADGGVKRFVQIISQFVDESLAIQFLFLPWK
jgi:hypothetical protein